MSNASGRHQTNSAPTANHISAYSRPISSSGNHLNQTHHYGDKSGKTTNNGPIIMRNLDKPSGVGTQVRLIKNTTPSLNSSNYISVRILLTFWEWTVFCYVVFLVLHWFKLNFLLNLIHWIFFFQTRKCTILFKFIKLLTSKHINS